MPASAPRRPGPARLGPAAAAAAIAVVTAACAGAFRPPAGPGTPAPAGDAAWRAAFSHCADARAIRAELGLSGRIAGQRVAGVTVGTAVDGARALGLEARVSSKLLFRLAGEAGAATLLLADDNRVVTAPAEDIVDALVGVKLSPARWIALVSGCVSRDERASRIEQHGDVLTVTTGDAVVYLQQREGHWTPRAGAFEGFSVDYPRYRDGWPAELTIRSDAGRSPAVTLKFDVRVIEINPTLPPAVFQMPVPPDATPMSLAELRKAGPLRGEER